MSYYEQNDDGLVRNEAGFMSKSCVKNTKSCVQLYHGKQCAGSSPDFKFNLIS